MPTAINNVETLANVPYIVRKGSEAFRWFGTEKSPGTKTFSVSGRVKKPGNYEAPFGIPLRELIPRVLRQMRPLQGGDILAEGGIEKNREWGREEWGREEWGYTAFKRDMQEDGVEMPLCPWRGGGYGIEWELEAL